MPHGHATIRNLNDHSPLDDEFDDLADHDEFPGNASADTEAEVACPYCGEIITIGLDPGSGTNQEYVEDCQVCCRPWTVRVHYDEEGTAGVWLEPEQGA